MKFQFNRFFFFNHFSYWIPSVKVKLYVSQVIFSELTDAVCVYPTLLCSGSENRLVHFWAILSECSESAYIGVSENVVFYLITFKSIKHHFRGLQHFLWETWLNENLMIWMTDKLLLLEIQKYKLWNWKGEFDLTRRIPNIRQTSWC